MRRVSLSVALAITSGCAAVAQPPAASASQEFALVHLAGEATFVEMKSLKVDGGLANFRSLTVARTGQPQVGGWRQMMINCDQNEFYRLAVAEVDETGTPGPDRPLSGQIYPVLPDSPEDGMAAAVCDKAIPYPDRAGSIAEATKLGRAKLSGAG